MLASSEDRKTVTDMIAYWKQPSASSTLKRALDIGNACLTSVKKLKQNPATKDIRHVKLNAVLPKVDLAQFLKNMEKEKSSSGLYKVFPPWCNSVANDGSIKFDPTKLRSLFQLKFKKSELEELIKIGGSVKKKIHLPTEQIKLIEQQTRNQNSCQKWYDYRAGRITASSMREVKQIRSFDSNISLIKKICYPNKKGKIANPMRWGLDHESDAVAAYYQSEEKKHVLLEIEKCGLFIHKDYQFIAGSPDRMVKCLCCSGFGLIEVKCPFTLVDENKTFKDLPYLNSDGKLDTDSSYFYQIQTQLMCTQAAYCEFVIWSRYNAPKIQRIFPDDAIMQKIISTSAIFFDNVVLPELLGRYYTQKAVSAGAKKKQKSIDNKENLPP